MKSLLMFAFGLVSSTSILAKSHLPPCDPALVVTAWTNCFGTISERKDVAYVGEFKNGRFHGYGRYTEYGNEYVGQYLDGVREGIGTFTWASGSTYVGEWVGHMRHGLGIYTSRDGSPPLEGLWRNSQFIRAERIPDHIAGRIATAEPVKEPQLKHSVAPIESAKEKCRVLGFKLGTEKFGDCVLRLSK